MIIWNEYYRFAAKEVEAIGTSERTSSTHPYVLTVYLKSGNKFAVSYADEVSRRNEASNLSRQIDMELKRDSETIIKTLFLLLDTTKRIDKRQLRIWKQLKDLLGLKMEDSENEPC